MRFTVVWKPEAERQLAAIWLDATDRTAITRAAHSIDQTLQHDAHQAGESRNDGRRVLLEPPLGVVFRAVPDDRMVAVIGVWSFQPRRRDV